MTTEKRLIDAVKLEKAILDTSEGLADCDQQHAAWVLRTYAVREINDAPTVDAVEVVRCKDCENCTIERAYFPGDMEFREFPAYYCKHPRSEIDSEPLAVEANDFCSYGERRTK